MHELFATLGVDWKLLIAQGLNFGVVLGVLTFFVYRPLMRIMDERRQKIEKGLEDAARAEERLSEIASERKAILRDADKEGRLLIEKSEAKSKEYAALALKRTDEEAKRVLEEAMRSASRAKEEELMKLKGVAGALVASAIAKAVDADPVKVDKALVGRAADILKKDLRSL